MTTRVWSYAKDIQDYCYNHTYEDTARINSYFSTTVYFSVQHWENVPTLTQTAITSLAATNNLQFDHDE